MIHSFEAKLAEVKLEIVYRKRVYENLIRHRKMKRAEAEIRIAIMEEIAEDYDRAISAKLAKIRKRAGDREHAALKRAEAKIRKRAGDREHAALKRAEAGAVERAVYLAKSVSPTKPWDAEGVSRATWYRRGIMAQTPQGAF